MKKQATVSQRLEAKMEALAMTEHLTIQAFGQARASIIQEVVTQCGVPEGATPEFSRAGESGPLIVTWEQPTGVDAPVIDIMSARSSVRDVVQA